MEEKDIKPEEKKTNENTPLQPIQEVATIMPTMIDDSDDDNKIKRDLSSIVPQFETIENKAGTELTSKDAVLKSDGSETIATLDTNGESILKADFKMPEQIDIKLRKEQQTKEKIQKKKKEKTKPTKAAKKQQNIISLAALIIIIGLVAFYFLVVKAPGAEDFTPLTVTIELGDKLPIRTSAYVKPGVGTNVDELQYMKDTSQVVLEEVGTYTFSITYQGITKYGQIIIQDTTSPNLETRDVTITEGTTYSASSFVESCLDHSGCNYSFQDSETTHKYTAPGSYIVYIVATDAYNNHVTKKANLFIEAKGIVKNYIKETTYDFSTGYSITESYQLNFAEYTNYSLLFSGLYTKTFTYQDDTKYQKARDKYNGEVNYQCIDHERKIVYTKSVTMIGSNYTKLEDIQMHFAREGFIEK